MPDGMSSSSNGASMQQQEISLIQERTIPSSPGALYSPHSKGSGFMKGGLGQISGRKQFMGAQTVVDNSRGMLQWVQSISFASISMDHSLQFVLPADAPSTGKQFFHFIILWWLWISGGLGWVGWYRDLLFSLGFGCVSQ